VLKGQASEDLLGTYEQERLPVARATVLNAFAHYVHRTEPSLSHLIEKFSVSEFPIEHVELAYRYHSKALPNDKIKEREMTEDPAIAVARPGSIAHHVLVDTPQANGVPISSFFGPTFVLFLGPEAQHWKAVATATDGQSTGLPGLKVQELVFDADSAFAKRYAVSRTDAVLVRPDGFVAWSSSYEVQDGRRPESIWAKVVKRVLCL